MPYTPATRNRVGIQFAAYRDGFDQKFEVVHDALSAAYYDFWRHGNASAVQVGDLVFNVLAGTPRIRRISTNQVRNFPNVTAKQFYDRLHAKLHRIQFVKFHQLITSLPVEQRPPAEKYDMAAMDARASEEQTALDNDAAAGFELEIPDV